MRNAFYDLDAELSVVGAMLQDPGTLQNCGLLTRDDFQHPELGAAYAAILALTVRHEPVDLITVDNQLTRDLGEHRPEGITQLLVKAMQHTPSTANIRAYIEIVRDRSNRRRLSRLGTDIARMAQDETVDVAQAVDSTRQGLRALDHGKTDWEPISQTIMETYEALNRRMSGQDKPITSGIATLDRAFYGFVPGEVTVIGARPGVGKSAFAGAIAVNAAKQGAKVGIVSLEMSRIQYGQRLLARSALVDSQLIRKAELDEENLMRVVQAMGDVSALPMEFMFNCRTLEALSTAIQRRVDEHRLDMVIIDYLQLLRTERKCKSDYERVTYISQSLKELAVMLEIPIIALAQLSRANQGRADKRPVLSDLRDSGSIEQDADNVIFLHRPEDPTEKGVNKQDREAFQAYISKGYHYIYISIEKQRQGQIGEGNLLFDPRLMTYIGIKRGAA